MYIETEDYQTIWNLGHNWTGHDPESTDPKNLPKDLQLAIQRMLAAILRNKLPARCKKLAILMDETLFTFLFDFRHFYRIYRCIHNDDFDKKYLNSIRVRRAEIIDWCKKEYIDPPPIWQIETEKSLLSDATYDASEDESDGWYNELSNRRKQIVVCLDLAKKLWLEKPEQSYEEIHNHPSMRKFGNPNIFSLDAFKRWSRPFASEYAKTGGRPTKIK